ncbi:hypothetical protein BRADI_5g15705v3 [Brachypodium distachyon]|uniref:Uncharacterized protein n=1 Tax=Brachypodium distachyon TaxID=15368 RepID=A0A2K2CHH2_BRADI|nr:hypothetical protein BRADI_5g15705v3 [Brachypodium distachyon]
MARGRQQSEKRPNRAFLACRLESIFCSRNAVRGCRPRPMQGTKLTVFAAWLRAKAHGRKQTLPKMRRKELEPLNSNDHDEVFSLTGNIHFFNVRFGWIDLVANRPFFP